MRKEARVIGIDDSPFKRGDKNVLVIGTIFRGGVYMDGLLSTKVRVDGNNATTKLTKMINECKFKTQLKAIFLDGIALGGFNVVDVYKLAAETELPVIVVVRKMPNYEKIYAALEMLGMKKKINIIKKLPPPVKIGQIYIQHIDITLEKAKKLIELTATHSAIPEAIRIAHIIGRGVVTGESKGRA